MLAEHRVDALVAHNARFDRGFFARAWRAHERPETLPPFLCSVRAARRLVSAPRYGLDALVAQLAIPPRARHRALGDAEMTADLWIELVGARAARRASTRWSRCARWRRSGRRASGGAGACTWWSAR